MIHWYNNVHYHSGVAHLTPASVHYGRGDQILKKRDSVMARAFTARPDRFNHRQPKLFELPKEVWINKPTGQELQIATPAMLT